jgi:(p)ppGpp synthase/HD superfamily hydrolase
MVMGPKFSEAMVFAADLHAEQTRKGSETPYLGHLLAVASLVIEAGGTEEQAIAALLHDAVEDQGGQETAAVIGERFGDHVLEMVNACSDSHEIPKPPWKERKERYLKHLPEAIPTALLISSADKLHNCRCILRDYRELGEALWSRFRGGRDGTLWYYGALAKTYDRCPMPANARLVATEFSAVVDQLLRLTAVED